MDQSHNPYRRCGDMRLTRAGNLEEKRDSVCTHDLAKGCLVGDLLGVDGPWDPKGQFAGPMGGPLAVWLELWRTQIAERQNPEYE